MRAARCAQLPARRTTGSRESSAFDLRRACQDVQKFVDVYNIDMDEAGTQDSAHRIMAEPKPVHASIMMRMCVKHTYFSHRCCFRWASSIQ